MTSFVFTIIISLIIIFIFHRGFHHIKHYLTNEEKENIGVFHSKKYDELIDELKDIKKQGVANDVSTTIESPQINMEDELTNFMDDME